MRKILFSVSVLGIVLVFMSAFTIDDDTLTGVFRTNYIQSVTVPAGWKVKQGGFKGSVIEKTGNSNITMYVNTFQAETEMRFIENVIAEEIETYREAVSGLFEVHDLGRFQVDRKKHVAHIRHIYGAKDAQYQAIAYIGEVGQIVSIAMLSDDKNLFQASLNDFKTFVESYTVYSEKEFTALNAQKPQSNSTLRQNGAPDINNRPSKKTFY